jgi:diaminopimelate decarboxylase
MKLNANALEELDRLSDCQYLDIGIRINTLNDIDAPQIYDVSTLRSKFGIPIFQREAILNAALNNPKIKGLHIHAGSEIGDVEAHTDAIRRVVDLADEINEIRSQIEWIDIGGGVKAAAPEEEQQGLHRFIELLSQKCPQLFHHYKVITEYGRFVHTHCAFVASKVEYILENSNVHTALIHVGADLFVREVYSKHAPKHQLFPLRKDGKLITTTASQEYDIAGPLCFSGDFLAREIVLPKFSNGDYIVITDAGANSISMWSAHCSREKPFTCYV